MFTFQKCSIRWTYVHTGTQERWSRVLTKHRRREGGDAGKNPRFKSEGKGWGRKEGEQPEERRVKQLARAGGRGCAQTERGRGWRERGELQAGGGGCWQAAQESCGQGNFRRGCQKGLEPRQCEAVDSGGSNRQPLAGDALAERERGKGSRQASVWGPCQ